VKTRWGSPAELVLGPRIVVCVGTGGVGKTTLAAALALGAARRGRRALVLTIDPARRLADALGVESLGNQPHALPREALTRLGVPEKGELSAMMLDMKRTFDDLVERFADSPASRERILRNPIYQHVSDALAGSAEYSAMEKVYEIAGREDLDLIVLDTPPSQHALDFLEAPERLLEFLDSRIVQLLLHPAFAAGRLGFRVFQRGAHRVLQTLERVSGISFLQDVSEFLLAFEGMSEGFRARAREVRRLLYGPESAFLLVLGPSRESVAHAGAFLERLETSGARVAGLVANRVHVWPGGPAPPTEPAAREAATAALAAALARSEGADFPARLAAEAALRAAHGYAAMAEQDERSTAAVRERAQRSGYFWRSVPELDRDVHDLEALARLDDHLFGARAGAEGA
jgi:anion-transporting  ArsA/GET3 family ATPase